jgi:hypothetical protein
MRKESLKLIGRVTAINVADQSFLVETKTGGHKNCRYVYANDALFRKLSRTIETAQCHSGKGLGMTGTFYIQGKVLMCFETGGRKTWDDLLRAAKAWVERGDSSE